MTRFILREVGGGGGERGEGVERGGGEKGGERGGVQGILGVERKAQVQAEVGVVCSGQCCRV